MPAKIFVVEKKADKDFLKLPQNIQEKIINAYSTLKINPIAGAKLKGELANYYKFRVGDYRIVYKFNSKESILEVVKIEHRQGVYK